MTEKMDHTIMDQALDQGVHHGMDHDRFHLNSAVSLVVTTSFGTTDGLAYASCNWKPLRLDNTAVLVSALRAIRALLRETSGRYE